MSRRKRKPVEENPLTVIDPIAAEIMPGEVLPQPPLDRRLAVASVVIRNMIGVAGVLFLGWSAQALIVLYLFDTLGAMLSIFAALMASFFSSTRASLSDRMYNLLTALALGAFLAAFLAIPLGMPVLILTMSTSWSFKEALAEPGFVLGVLTILGMALLNTVYWWVRVDVEGQRGERALKREFTLIFGRWLFIIFAIYTPLVIFVAAAPVILVIVYAVVTTYTELFPDRFARIFDRVERK